MSWLALTGPGVAWTCPARMTGPQAAGHALLARGSLVIEARLAAEDRPQILLGYEQTEPWQRIVAVQAVPGQGVRVLIGQGARVLRASLESARVARGEPLRITYSWDAPAGWGRLAAERPGRHGFDIAATAAPVPLLMSDIAAMTTRPALRAEEAETAFFAWSDGVEPVGPMPGLTGALPVETPFGVRPLGTLRPGDTVRTRDDGVQPVLAVLDRVVPGLGSFRPVVLRAPALGLSDDVAVAPDQRFVVGGSDVEYCYGGEAVRIAAGVLAAPPEPGVAPEHLFVRYRQVLLPRHSAMLAAGSAVESLYAGRLRRMRARLAATMLADLEPGLVPEHGLSAYRTLSSGEAAALVAWRAA